MGWFITILFNYITDKPPAAPEIIPKISDKPPKGRAPSPETTEPAENITVDEAPSWRRSASFRNRQQDNNTRKFF